MKRTITLSILLSLFVSFTFAQNKLNLDPTTASRFAVTDKVWPTNVGEADVCLWNDDKLAAFTITIDDNNEQDIAFWETMHSTYGFNFTWFVITEADPAYNVSDAGWLKYNELALAGNQINGHDDRNYGNGFSTTPEEYSARLKRTIDKVEEKVTEGNNKCLTYAYPFGDGDIEVARKQFIGMRGTVGKLNNADKVNYLDVNSISNPHIFEDLTSRDFYILPLIDKNETLYNVKYYRGWGSTHFHSVASKDNEDKTDEFLQYLKDKNDLWVDGFTRVAQYSQSFATHKLLINSVTDTEVKFTLTDDMLDTAFDFPLTVKIRVNNNWDNVTSTQNGNPVETKIIEKGGNKYVLVKAVPDGGQVVVTGTGSGIDSDPVIISPINNQQVKEEENVEVDFTVTTTSANFTLSTEGLPSFGQFIDNGTDGKFIFSPLQKDKGVYLIKLLADNGTSVSITQFEVEVTSDNVFMSLETENSGYISEEYIITYDAICKLGKSDKTGNPNLTSVILPFRLPALPFGNKSKLVSASLDVYVSYGREWTNTNIDLYGLDFRGINTIISSDYYYSGSFNQGIEDDFFTKNVDVGQLDTPRWESTSDEGNVALYNYIKAQYEAGAKEGEWVFMRLSVDNVDMTTSHYFKIEGSGSDHPAVLELVFIEDSSLSSASKEFSNLSIYPNPVSNGQITISSSDFNSSKKIEVEVCSVGGQLVKKTTEKSNGNSFQLDLGNQTNKGIYFLKINDGNFSTVKKIIIK